MTAAIECEYLTRRFFRTVALDGIDLTVPEGSIFGLLGPNGAGKTTTIKVALNLLSPSDGAVRVLGIDSRRLRPEDYAQVGYLSENQRLPGWMRVRELFDYLTPFYPTWDKDFVCGLARRLDLPLDRRISTVSRGMRLKAALVCGLAFRPRLLVLDEPFSGLDALVRDEVVESILELAGEENWTVFLSSHEITEIENLIDHVAFLSEGGLRFSEEIEPLRGRFRAIEVTGVADAPSLRAPASWVGVESAGSVLRFVETQYADGATERAVRELLPAAAEVSARPMSLREIFVALAKAERKEARQ